MRNRTGLCLIAAIVLTMFPSLAQERVRMLAIRGATVIDGTGRAPRKDVVILVHGDRLELVGANESLPEGVKVVDAEGKFILPGFLDSRVRIGPTPGNHLSRREIGIEQRLDSLRALVTTGVTTVRLIQGSLLEQELYQRWAQDDLLASPVIVTSGPVFTAKDGHPVEEYSVLSVEARNREIRQITGDDDAREKSREVAHAGADTFEVIYDRGPQGKRMARSEKSVLEILLQEAKGHGLPAFCETGSDEEAGDAATAGATGIEGVWDEALSAKTLELMAKRQVYFVPALTQQGDLLNMIGEEQLKAYLASPIVRQSLSPVMQQSLASASGTIVDVRSGLSSEAHKVSREALQEQQRRAFENVRRANEAGVKIAVGTGAGNLLILRGPSVHRELQLLVNAGLTPMEAIVAATANTAASLGKGGELGTIETGKKANLIILEADPLADIRNTEKVYEVIRDGREMRWADYPPR